MSSSLTFKNKQYNKLYISYIFVIDNTASTDDDINPTPFEVGTVVRVEACSTPE